MKFHIHLASKLWAKTNRRFFVECFRTGLIFFGAFVLGISQAYSASDEFVQIQNPCTSSESWQKGDAFAREVPDEFQKYFEIPSNFLKLIQTIKKLELLRKQNPSKRVLALSEYVAARGFLDHKLPHLAYFGFKRILKGYPNDLLTKQTIGACLQELHKTIPSIKLPSEFRVKSEFSKTLASLNKIVSKRGSTTLTQPASEFLLKSFTENEDQFPNRDLFKNTLTLNLARSFYQKRFYDNAIEFYEKVSKESNLYADAISEKAWAYLMKGNYDDAAATAYNFVVGELKAMFSPESYLILGISYYENCQYMKALQITRLFRSKFNSIYQKLYEWFYQDQKKIGNYYDPLSQFLLNQNSKSKVPKPILSQWMKSPIFNSLQNDINLLFSEQSTTEALLKEIEVRTKGDDETKENISNLIKDLSDFKNAIPKIQDQLIDEINLELSLKNKFMISTLIEAYENIQLLEADINEKLGIRSLSPNSPLLSRIPVAPLESTSSGLPVLDWGEVSTKEQQETWEDEIGDLRNAKIPFACEVKK